MSEPVASPTKTHGGKAPLARRIVALMPPRKSEEHPGGWLHYCEPFAGGLNVLFASDPEGISEVVNDLDRHLCLGPDARVLMNDLRWKRIGDVRVGDAVASFDEHNGPPRAVGLCSPTRYRRWQIGAVTASSVVKKPSYRLVFDDGTEVVASADHQWLGGSHVQGGRGWRWQRTDGLVCNRANQRSWVMKVVPVVGQEQSWEAGWLAGFFDGEGSLSPPPGWSASASQKDGPEADMAEGLLRDRGFDVRRDFLRPQAVAGCQRAHPMIALNINGGLKEVMRFLMLIRPERLIRKAVAAMPDRSLYGREKQAVGLVAKEFLGEREVVAIETTSRTYIAEGLASHNCNFWRVLACPVQFPAFARALAATPFSERHWEDAACILDPQSGSDELARAVAFFVHARQSMAARGVSFAALSRTRTRRGMNEQAAAWLSAVEGLGQVHERLKRVVILNRDALDVVRANDGPATLFYCDPPYLPSTRTAPDVYRHEMTAGQHEALLDALLACRGKVMLSGYPSDLYDGRLLPAGWRRVDMRVPNHAAGGATKRVMTESLYLNYPPTEG
jgi:DNA adenine methylase